VLSITSESAIFFTAYLCVASILVGYVLGDYNARKETRRHATR
jgi:ABC-type cobalt transport system substrate-binding protein